RRDRLAADLVGGRALDDRPVYPLGLAVLFDILEAAVDDRVEGIELRLRLALRQAAPAPRRPSAAPISLIAALTTALAAALIVAPIAAPGAVARAALAFAITRRVAGRVIAAAFRALPVRRRISGNGGAIRCGGARRPTAAAIPRPRRAS